MFSFRSTTHPAATALADLDDSCKAVLDAIHRVQAIIRFRPDGTILHANQNFLTAMGYTLPEIEGRHHRIFVDAAYAASPEYAAFWRKLQSGEFHSGEFKRIARDGSEVWIHGSYNPILGPDGSVQEVVKFATEITAQKRKALDDKGQMDAIQRVMAVIEFDLDGTIRTANENFLKHTGYTLPEIEGRHHRIFVSSQTAASESYARFWKALASGEPQAGIFPRLGKSGQTIWLQASYNPILDWNGKPYKVVKYATDLTEFIRQTETTQHTSQSVAAASEEMACSIAEISRNMQMSREAAGHILDISQNSSQHTSELVVSMKSMQSFVGLIREIAARVNMLALNATIEAARAGEAGKGFAVVASEVKNLSDQTAKATQQISQEIATVQKYTGSVAESVRQTMDGATQMNGYVSSVATAIEQQSAATRQISEHCSSLVTAVETILRHTQQG
jgi:methyl-accepting chemotaxis protein